MHTFLTRIMKINTFIVKTTFLYTVKPVFGGHRKFHQESFMLVLRCAFITQKKVQRTSLYDKRDDFNFHITNFPFPSSNIPSSPAYCVFISQLIRYARACSSYGCFIQTLHQFANLLPNWTLLPILTLLTNFRGFHRTLQLVRLANRGHLLLRTPGPVPFGTCICSNVETILS